MFLKTECGDVSSMIRVHGSLTRKELQKERGFEG